MSRQLPLLLAAVLGGLGVWAGWRLVAEPLATPEALGAALLAGLVAIWVAAALWGAGRGAAWLISVSFSRDPLRQPAGRGLGRSGGTLGSAPSGPTAWLHHLVLGHLVCTAALLVLGALGWLGPVSAALLFAILTLGWLAPLPLPRLPRWGSAWTAALAAGLAVALALAGMEALAPPTDTDELFWHLAVPGRILAGEGLPGGWLDPVASRPLPLQLLWAGLLATGGEAAPALLHLLVAGGVILGVAGVARRHGASPAAAAWGAALLAGSWSFLMDAGLTHDNLPTALLVLAGLDAALQRRAAPTGLALGAALAMKYTAAPAAAVVLLVLAWRTLEDRGLRHLVPAGLIAGALLLLPVAPWWIRNLLDGLHPLFPYAGWEGADGFVFAWPAKYGLGHDLVHLLRLPWDLVFSAETTSFAFLGRVHPAWLLFLPGLVWVALWERRERLLAVASALGLVGWFLGVQWIRHLLPLAPVLAVGASLAAERLPDSVMRVAWITWLLLLPPQTLDLVKRAAELGPVVTGQQSRDEWLTQEIPAYEAIHWVNEHTAPGDTVALLFAGPTYLVQRPTLLGSVEDHTPSRYLLWRHGDDSLQVLREQGADWLITGRSRFLRKTYPFLSDAEFDALLVQPGRTLDEQLPLQATLVFEGQRFSVWSLGLDGSEGRR